MQVAVEKGEKNKVILKVEVDEHTVNNSLHQTYKELAKKYKISGFRPGKTPPMILKNVLGEGEILNHTLEKIVPESYVQALKENNIDAINHPQFKDFSKLEEGKTFTYTAEVEVMPDIDIDNYKGLELTKLEKKEVTEEDILNQLKALQNQHARLKPDEESPVTKDHFINLGFNGKVNDIILTDDEVKLFLIDKDTTRVKDDIQEKFYGLKQGEEISLNFIITDDFSNKDLIGKTAEIKIKIIEVKKKILPELNDDFSKEFNFNTLEELKNQINEELKNINESKDAHQLEEEIMQQLTKNLEVEIPPILIDREKDKRIKKFKDNLNQYKIPEDNFFTEQGFKNEDDQKFVNEKSIETVKRELTIKSIAKKENIMAEENEIEDEIKKLAVLYKMNADELKKILYDEGNIYILEEVIKYKKTIDFIKNNANFIEKTKQENEIQDENKTEEI